MPFRRHINKGHDGCWRQFRGKEYMQRFFGQENSGQNIFEGGGRAEGVGRLARWGDPFCRDPYAIFFHPSFLFQIVIKKDQLFSRQYFP
jgi:hypothetical protein